MTRTTRVKTLIVEDSDLMARGILEFLETVPMVQVVATAGNGEEARRLVQSQKIDLVIMDIRLGSSPNGMSLTEEFKKMYPDLAILIYSADGNVELMRQAIAAGASSYVPKNAGINKLKTAIDVVMAGGSYFPRLPRDIEPLTPKEEEVLKLIAEGKNNEQISQKLGITPTAAGALLSHIMSKLDIHKKPLTPHEEKVLQLIAEGKDNEQISQELNILLVSVGTKISNIMSKLDIHNRAELRREAIRRYGNPDDMEFA